MLPAYSYPAVQVQAVKEKIESTQGDSFPAAHQVVIYQGKVWSGASLCSAIKEAISAYWLIKYLNAAQVLKDDTSLEENKISNENFVVVMVTRVSEFSLPGSHQFHVANAVAFQMQYSRH